MKSPLAESLNLQLTYVDQRVRLAGLIVLSLELAHLRKALGYEGMGSWQAFREEAKSGERLRWEDYCVKNAGITDTCGRLYQKCAEVVKTRLSWYGDQPEAKRLLEMLGKAPSSLSDDEREWMVEHVALLGLTGKDTQTSLRRDYRDIQERAKAASGKTPAAETQDQPAGIKLSPDTQRRVDCVMIALRAMRQRGITWP